MTALAQLYDLAGSEDWQVVLRHFELGQGFAFLVLLVPNEDGAAVCREALADFLATRGQRLHVVLTDSFEAIENLADTLLNLRLEEDKGAVWVSRAVPDALPDYARWREAWRMGVARLNQQRNPLRRQFAVPLIFVGAPWLQEVLRESSPDLWSVRTLVPRVEPRALPAVPTLRPSSAGPSGPGPDPEFALEEARKLSAKNGDQLAVADILHRAGLGFASRDEWNRAAQTFSRALGIRRGLSAPREKVAETSLHLGEALMWSGLYGDAWEMLSRASESYSRDKNAAGAGRAIRLMGDVAIRLNDIGSARRLYRESLRLFQQAGDATGAAIATRCLGNVAVHDGDLKTAGRLYQKALRDSTSAGDVQGMANCIWNLAELALQRSDFASAQSRYVEAQSLFRSAGDILGDANCVVGLGRVKAARGDRSGAHHDYLYGLEILNRRADPYLLGVIHRLLASVVEGKDRDYHCAAAREQWSRIGRTDLVADLDREFPRESLIPPETPPATSPN